MACVSVRRSVCPDRRWALVMDPAVAWPYIDQGVMLFNALDEIAPFSSLLRMGSAAFFSLWLVMWIFRKGPGSAPMFHQPTRLGRETAYRARGLRVSRDVTRDADAEEEEE